MTHCEIFRKQFNIYILLKNKHYRKINSFTNKTLNIKEHLFAMVV